MITKSQQVIVDAHDIAVDRIEFSTQELMRYSDRIAEKQYQTVLNTLHGLEEQGYLKKVSWTTWTVGSKWEKCIGGEQ